MRAYNCANLCKGHFNWVSEAMVIMKDNNINEMQISKFDISNKLKNKFKNHLLNRIHAYGDGKKLRTYAEFKRVIKYESYLNTVKKY